MTPNGDDSRDHSLHRQFEIYGSVLVKVAYSISKLRIQYESCVFSMKVAYSISKHHRRGPHAEMAREINKKGKGAQT